MLAYVNRDVYNKPCCVKYSQSFYEVKININPIDRINKFPHEKITAQKEKSWDAPCLNDPEIFIKYYFLEGLSMNTDNQHCHYEFKQIKPIDDFLIFRYKINSFLHMFEILYLQEHCL